MHELDGAVWRKGTAAFRLLPFIDRDDPIIQELADLEDEEPGEPSGIRDWEEKGIDQEASESSDSDTDSDIDSAAHVSTDAKSEASEEED